jgi:hypothetical protein
MEKFVSAFASIKLQPTYYIILLNLNKVINSLDDNTLCSNPIAKSPSMIDVYLCGNHLQFLTCHQGDQKQSPFVPLLYKI